MGSICSWSVVAQTAVKEAAGDAAGELRRDDRRQRPTHREQRRAGGVENVERGGSRSGVGGEHDQLTRQPIAPDTADEDEGNGRQRVSGEDDADVGSRGGQLEDGERQRSQDDGVEPRQRLTIQRSRN